MTELILGDCLEVMAGMEADSVDAIVTDPPYGLSFMGKDWDHGVPGAHFWQEALHVLKPSHYLLAFGGTRTWHRLACALEDAGFQIRDTLMWLYGSGFPKGKANLKPAWEPIILCRKPGAKVGELGIDECRIGTEVTVTLRHGHSGDNGVYGKDSRTFTRENPGRWPANLILDETSAAMLDEQSGVSKSTGGRISNISKTSAIYGSGKGLGQDLSAADVRGDPGFGDVGGASRFFYCPKSSRSERNTGCEGLEAKNLAGHNKWTDVDYRKGSGEITAAPHHNYHPTVKPVALMTWLVRLIAEPGATVLDPFMGSGTTGVACAKEGREFIGIEKEPEYLEIARCRIDAHERQGVLV